MSDKKQKLDIPDDIVESFARSILSTVKEYFESEEGKSEFEKWKAGKDERRDISNTN